MATDQEELELELEYDQEEREIYQKLVAEIEQNPREKFSQFLKSFEETHKDIDARTSAAAEEEEKTQKKCVICNSKYDSEKDTYNWISGGLQCCSSPVHYSCLVRWRFNNQRNSDNQLIVWCPICTTKRYIRYIPAVWFFNKFGDVLENFLRIQDKIVEEGPHQFTQFLLIDHAKKMPIYFKSILKILCTFSTAQIIRLERKKLNILATTSETMEKEESDGLEKFIQNYYIAKLSKYPEIPHLDSEGNREDSTESDD